MRGPKQSRTSTWAHPALDKESLQISIPIDAASGVAQTQQHHTSTTYSSQDMYIKEERFMRVPTAETTRATRATISPFQDSVSADCTSFQYLAMAPNTLTMKHPPQLPPTRSLPPTSNHYDPLTNINNVHSKYNYGHDDDKHTPSDAIYDTLSNEYINYSTLNKNMDDDKNANYITIITANAPSNINVAHANTTTTTTTANKTSHDDNQIYIYGTK